MYPAITLISGPKESGRTTYAVLICSEFFQMGIPCFHNSTALFGWDIKEHADTHDGLLTLADEIPERSTILIEEADAKKATRQTGDPDHEAAINAALAILAEKSCYLILTTVQGNECLIAKALLQYTYEHVTPFMEAGRKDSVALATLHRFGQYLVPAGLNSHDPETVVNAMMLADTFKEMRLGARDGKNVEYTKDRLFEVPQISIDEMNHPKHPEYPVYYRHRILRPMPNGGIHRLTQDSILHFTWLESVNEHPNETVALEMLTRTMPQWGFEYDPVPTAQDTNFPDGRAFINGELTNLEVVSIQPQYPGGHNLHHLVALTQAGRAEKPGDTALLRCHTCHTTELLQDATWETLPEHDPSHRWVIYLPGSFFAPNCPSDFAATPVLDIQAGDFIRQLESAVANKSRIIAEKGKGQRNWVIVLSQGFPVDPVWVNQLPRQWPENIDGICVVATEDYVGAFKNLVPFKDFTGVLLKCPPDFEDHNCFHPGYTFRVSGMDTDFQPLSKDRHTIEEVSAAAWNYPLPSTPVKKILVVRDQQERELQTFWGAAITDPQVKEIIDEAGFHWRQLPTESLLLCTEGNAIDQGDCAAEVRRLENGKSVAAVYFQGCRFREEFVTVEEAKEWCEHQVALLLLHIEG